MSSLRRWVRRDTAGRAAGRRRDGRVERLGFVSARPVTKPYCVTVLPHYRCRGWAAVLKRQAREASEAVLKQVRLCPRYCQDVSGVYFHIQLRPGHAMRTKCAISDAFVRDCVFAYRPSVAQYVYSLSAEHFSDYAKTHSRTNASEIAHFVRIV